MTEEEAIKKCVKRIREDYEDIVQDEAKGIYTDEYFITRYFDFYCWYMQGWEDEQIS